MYVVLRTATKNPFINGCTLYLSRIGLWTLDIEHAIRFDTEAAARKRCRKGQTIGRVPQ